jgi:hypothetical protein
VEFVIAKSRRVPLVMGEMDGTLVSEDKVVHTARKPPFMPCMVLAQGAFDILNWMFD